MTATNNQVVSFVGSLCIARLRTLLRRDFGAGRYRLTADGDVHVFGAMPNSTATGWYLKGSLRAVEAEYQL